MKLELFQSVLDEFANSFIKWLNAPPPSPKGPTPQQIEQQKKEQEKKKQEALAKWKMLQKEEAFNRAQENELKRKAGQDLLSQMQPVGGGSLTPFKWEEGRDSGLGFKPVATGQYPTAQYSAIQRLKCAAYFSGTAKNASNDEDARYYTEQADQVMAGQPTNMECRFPAGAEPPDPASANMVLQKLARISIDYREKVTALQETEDKLAETKKKVEAAQSKRDTAHSKLLEAKNYAATVQPEKKADADTLAAEALAALQEAEKEFGDAKAAEEELTNKKGEIEDDIKNLEKQVQAEPEK